MKPLASVALALLLTSAAPAQPVRNRLYTTPAPPPRDALEKLNLRQAWSTLIPMAGRRDGILSMQLAPLWTARGLAGMQLLVQTRSGLIVLLDAETGQVMWRTRVGDAYRGQHALGFSSLYVAVERGTEVYGLDRLRGELLWKFDKTATLTTAPLVGREFLYLPLTGARGQHELTYYSLPSNVSPVPYDPVGYDSPAVLQVQPTQVADYLVFPTSGGAVFVYDGTIPGPVRPDLTFSTRGALVAPVGGHEYRAGAAESWAYAGSRDGNVYARPLDRPEDGEPAWNFAAGGPVLRSPFVNDLDVYASGDGRGLYRLRRFTLNGPLMAEYMRRLGVVPPGPLAEVVKELGERQAARPTSLLTALQRKGYLTDAQRELLRWRGGEALWRYSEGDYVMAVNPKFVYAADTAGRLRILDRERGRELSCYDTRDFVVPFSNELTDRVYLAAHNGLIVCLHDRDYPAPVTMKTLLPPKADARPGPRNSRPPPAPPMGGLGGAPGR